MRTKIQSTHTKISREIKLECEVEKIWIIYDKDRNGTLELEEVASYLRNTAYPIYQIQSNIEYYPNLDLTDDEIEVIFKHIDDDDDDQVTKEEMVEFLRFMCEHN